MHGDAATTATDAAGATPHSVHPPDTAAAIPLDRMESAYDGLGAQDRRAAACTVGYVALSRFAVAQMTAQVKQAFRERPHQVDSAAGFVRMEVLSPCDAPNEIWLITFWTDEDSYRTWHHSHLYKESHRGIPPGLRLVPKSVSIRFFEHVAS